MDKKQIELIERFRPFIVEPYKDKIKDLESRLAAAEKLVKGYICRLEMELDMPYMDDEIEETEEMIETLEKWLEKSLITNKETPMAGHGTGKKKKKKKKGTKK